MPDIDSTVYRAQTYTTRDDWTPAKLRAARRLAELGTMRDAADLVEQLQTDDRVQGVLQTRLGGLMKLPTRIEDVNGDLDEDSPLAEALGTDFWTAFPEDDTAELMAWGYLLGLGLAEFRWDTAKRSDRLLPHLHVWHPRWLRFDAPTETWRLQTANAGEIELDFTSGRWALFAPYGGSKPWRKGIYRSLAHYWLLKRYALMDWGTYSEAHGQPLRVGSTPDSSTKPDREELAADLQNMAGVTGIALPPGFELSLLEATASTYDTFKDQIEAADKAIAITLLGQNLTTDVEGGSYAAANVHDTVRHDYIERDEQALSTWMHDQPLYWWALFNFGTEDTPWIRWNVDREERLKVEAHHLTVPIVTRNEIRESLGLPPLDGPAGEEFVTSGGPQPPRVSGGGDAVPPAGLGQGKEASVRLASGADPQSARGAIRGQLYIDRIARRATPLIALQANVDQLAGVIRNAESYDELLERLEQLYETMDPDEVAGLWESLVMADLAGRAAVYEDA